MTSWLVRSFVAVGLACSLVGCAPSQGDDTGEATGAVSSSSSNSSKSEEAIVRAYYAATRAEHPTDDLAPIVADGVVLSAPSVYLLKFLKEFKFDYQIEGKNEFIKAVAGNSWLLGKATIREIAVQGPDLAIARIDLPLPDGDTLTQVEYFTLENGKIKRLDSYYDAIRFAVAIPSIGWEGLKHRLGL